MKILPWQEHIMLICNEEFWLQTYGISLRIAVGLPSLNVFNWIKNVLDVFANHDNNVNNVSKSNYIALYELIHTVNMQHQWLFSTTDYANTKY